MSADDEERATPEAPLDDRDHAERGCRRPTYALAVLAGAAKCAECGDARAYVGDDDAWHACEACR